MPRPRGPPATLLAQLLLLCACWPAAPPTARAWPFRMGGVSRSRPVLSHDGETVFVGSFDNTTAAFPYRPAGARGPAALHALRAADGAHIWSFRIEPCIHSVGESARMPLCHSCGSFNTPTLSRDGGTLYLGGDDANFAAVNASTGELVWRAPVGSVVMSTASLSADGRLVILDTDENKANMSAGSKLLALATADGARAWELGCEAHVGACNGWFSDPQVSGTSVFAGGEDGVMYALRASDGKLAWRFDVTRGVGETKDTRICTKAAIDSAGRLFFASNTGRLWAVSASTGRALWSQRAGVGRADDYASPAISSRLGLVFFGVDKGSADQNPGTNGVCATFFDAAS